jgi:hypothetical protein
MRVGQRGENIWMIVNVESQKAKLDIIVYLLSLLLLFYFILAANGFLPGGSAAVTINDNVF